MSLHNSQIGTKRTMYIVLQTICNEYTADFGAKIISFEEYIRCPSATSCSYGRICWDPKAEPSNFIRVPPSLLRSAPETGTLRSNHPNGNTSSMNRFSFFWGVLLLRIVGAPRDEGMCMQRGLEREIAQKRWWSKEKRERKEERGGGRERGRAREWASKRGHERESEGEKAQEGGRERKRGNEG